MKSSDRAVLIGLGVVAVIAVFWIVVLGPKRKEASDLGTQIDTVQSQVAQNEQSAAAGEAAEKSFAHDYRRLIALGKAVPADADTPSLLNQLQTLAERSKVSFRTIELGTGSPSQEAPTVAAASTDPAAASEAAAALAPIGSTVGSAGLPVMPYSLSFQGGFFDVADFFGKLDGTVYTDKSHKVRVDGRLLTIDGFSLTAAPDGFPHLTANVAVTSYLAPADGGVTAGATPTGPAPLTSEPATGTSSETAPATAAVVGAN